MQPWRNLTSVLLLVSLPLATGLGVCRAEREPDSYSREARARFDQGAELQKKGQWLEAIRAFDDAERGGMKDFPRLHLYRAQCYGQLRDYRQAILRYTHFIDEFGLEGSCRY